MYNMESDGYSLDQKRDAIEANDIPDIIIRWNNRAAEADRTKYDKSFLVDKQEIVDNDYVFSFNKYQKKAVEKKTYRPTKDILASIDGLEQQFSRIMGELRE
jgi:type I restriction enzyme M protein